MKKRLITPLTPLLLLAMTIVPQTAQAKPASSTDCTSICSAEFYWGGTTYGLSSYVGVVGPTAGLTDTDSFYQFDLQLNNTSSYPRIDIGEVVNHTSSPSHGSICYGSGKGAFYYTTATDDGGHHLATWCWGVPSADVNQLAVFGTATSNGEFTVSITGNSGDSHIAYWQNSDVGNQFTRIRYLEQIQD